MEAGSYELRGRAGATLRRQFTLQEPDGTPVDLTGYTGRMDVRSAPGAPRLLRLAGPPGLTVAGPSGTVGLELTALQTRQLGAGVFVYDLQLVRGDEVLDLVAGALVLEPEITEPV